MWKMKQSVVDLLYKFLVGNFRLQYYLVKLIPKLDKKCILVSEIQL